MKSHRFTTKMGDDEIIIETGKLAEQAGGAVTVQARANDGVCHRHNEQERA